MEHDLRVGNDFAQLRNASVRRVVIDWIAAPRDGGQRVFLGNFWCGVHALFRLARAGKRVQPAYEADREIQLGAACARGCRDAVFFVVASRHLRHMVNPFLLELVPCDACMGLLKLPFEQLVIGFPWPPIGMQAPA